MRNNVKKGFTLIELMIVLAIIAILAVVLIPKAGTMKDNARNAGVTTNVNSVRATLETKTQDTNYVGNASNVVKLLSSSYATSAVNTTLSNPFNKTATAVSTGAIGTDSSSTNSVIVESITGNIPTGTSLPSVGTITDNKGVVVVDVYSDGFVVFGVDSTSSAINEAIVK